MTMEKQQASPPPPPRRRRRYCLWIPCLFLMMISLLLQISFHHRSVMVDIIANDWDEALVDMPPSHHVMNRHHDPKEIIIPTLSQEQKPPQSKRKNNNNGVALLPSSHIRDDGWTTMLQRAKEMLHHCHQLVTSQSTTTTTTSFDKTNNHTVISLNNQSMIIAEEENKNANRNNHNDSMAYLPPFGIIRALTAGDDNALISPSSPIVLLDEDTLPPLRHHRRWHLQQKCQLPPELECQETHLTAIYMGYKKERLQYLVSNIRQKVCDQDWQSLIQQVILVYNDMGRRLQNLSQTFPHRFQIVCALQYSNMGNHLMNRYHPMLNVSTQGIIYYDDDGPFLSFNATLAAFELWKRHANTQVGALGRTLDLSPRQEEEKKRQRLQQHQQQQDRFFISHCPGPVGMGDGTLTTPDRIGYNYETFPNFGANMVLPSNTIMHTNYRCFLWHPVLQEMRDFVATHPVYPDDLVVSMVISQLSGRAPRIYSRRFRPSKSTQQQQKQQKQQYQQQQQPKLQQKTKVLTQIVTTNNATSSILTSRRRQLLDSTLSNTTIEITPGASASHHVHSRHTAQKHHRRRLLWKDASSEEVWADRRSHAANMIASYFGSLNSGSLGWCFGTAYHHHHHRTTGMDTCEPFLAEVGMLPWMQPNNNNPKRTCP